MQGYVAVIAMVLYMILQIRMRKVMLTETEPLILAGKKKNFEPTANKIRELCDRQEDYFG
jgi:hypothetical protein